MRVMTHLNIGAALAMVAWTAWSGTAVVTGQITVPRVRPPIPAAGATGAAGPGAIAAPQDHAHCLEAAAQTNAGASLQGDDL